MNLLDLFIRIGAKDEASETIEGVSERAIPNLAKAASTAAKALAGMWAVKKIGEFGKAAFDAYSQFQQLEGGVEKLFGEESAKAVQANAQAAFSSMGLSANEYMEQVTSFSAALINDLGGDTAKAAEMADKAMAAMADNASIFGSDVQSIQNAFQGFAKQNYTMLDNLKLGYGGTKEEMERLISDANEYAAPIGEASDLSIDSYADIVQAIDLVQQKQGIAGNAAAEASKTISGSFEATKAAWKNLVLEFGKPDADIGARVGDMLTAVFGTNGEGGLFRNVMDEVGVIASNMGSAVAQGVQYGIDWLINEGPTRFQEALAALVETVSAWATSLLENPIDLAEMFKLEDGEVGIIDRLKAMGGSIADTVKTYGPQLVAATGTLFSTIGQTIVDNIPFVLDTVGGLLADIGSYIIENGPELAASAYEALLTVFETILDGGSEMVDSLDGLLENVVTTITDFLVNHGPDILAAAIRLFSNIATAIANNTPTIMAKIGELIGKLVGFVLSSAGKMLQAGIKFVGGLLDGSTEQGKAVREWFSKLPSTLVEALGSVGSLLTSAGKSIIQGFWDGLTSKFSEVKDWVGGIGTWIQEHKGPKEYDLGLLVDNGKYVMKSLENGLRLGYKGVQKFVGEIGEDLQAGFKTNVSIDAHNIAGRLAPSTSQKSVAGDTYIVYLKVEDRNDFDGMALAFVDAVAERNRLAGRSSTMNVRYE